jgi:hypothetical protein
MGLLLSLLIFALILCVALWIVRTIPFPAPFGMIAQVIIGVIALVFLIDMLMGGLAFPVVRC